MSGGAAIRTHPTTTAEIAGMRRKRSGQDAGEIRLPARSGSPKGSSPSIRGLMSMKKTTPKAKTTSRKPAGLALPKAKASSRKPCVVCGSEVAPFSEENLCWVCRRLKVSAWGETTDAQMFAAE